jgi:hypothetical protein
VFRQPQVVQVYARLQLEINALLQKKEDAAAEKRCREAIRLAPQYPDAHYNLACALARQGRKEEALVCLAHAIERGFNNAKHIKEDSDLESLRQNERFKKLLADAARTKPLVAWPQTIEAGKVKDGEVFVTEKNTTWDLRQGVFRTYFAPVARDKEREVIKGFGKAGDLVRQWYKEGTAAGNHGDLYDNHDGDHSNMHYQSFPQLTRIEFSKEAQAAKVHIGLQSLFVFNGVVLGNSSTALVSGPYWRSQPRLAYTHARIMRVLYNQYVNNHLYLYPEHRDHDPGHNGKGDGYGDVYPANTPFVLISQGSSGSDIVFLDALACTLAAFQPETKQHLVRHGLLMPTVQMIFRKCNKNVRGADDYLTGAAHPTVFEGGNVDVVKMVQFAHALKPDEVPAMVQLRVVKEEQPVLGCDYFDAEPRGEGLFDTPAAIARVLRSTQHTRRLVVSAEGSRDVNKRPLTFRWVVLRGDEQGVTIKPLNKESSVVELAVSWQERRPIAPGSRMESNRIDIGVFIDNGKHWSAPGFVTFFSLDNQKRLYDKDQRIARVDYADKEMAGNYVDPLVDLPKDWRDEYHYAKEGRLLGWTRTRGKVTQEFTSDGAVVQESDDKGRVLVARTVRYLARPRKEKAPQLESHLGDTVLRYEYASDDDRIGRLKSRKAP